MNQTEKLTHLKTQQQSVRIRIQWAFVELTEELADVNTTVGTGALKTQAEDANELTDIELIAFSKKIINNIKAEQHNFIKQQQPIPNLQNLKSLIQQFLIIIEETRQEKFPLIES